jgi:2-dehydropantoate 2-reductase
MAQEVIPNGFTIVGAGAIGAIVGVHLMRAGHGVAYIETNRAHVAAIRDGGLRLTGALDAVVRPQVMLPEEAPPLRQVLLAVKSRHTEDALATIAPLLAPDGYVVSLQNGLEEYKIARAVGRARTIGAFLTFGGHYREPGLVVYGGPGSFRIGELDGRTTPRLEALRAAFMSLQPVEITPNIFGCLWAKMSLGAIYNATALVSADVTEQYGHAHYRALFARLCGEVVAVADAAGVRCEPFDGFDPAVFRPGAAADEAAIAASWDGQRRYWNRHGPGAQRTGVWRDLAIHKRKTEIDEMIGAVRKVAREHAVATPLLDALTAMVHEVEDGKRELGYHNLDALIVRAQTSPPM